METQTNEKVVKRVLVFEDNPQEARWAEERLVEAEIKDYKIVDTLADGLDLIPQYDAVLTDLFFPAGNMPVQPFVDRFLPIYEEYDKKWGGRKYYYSRSSSIEDAAAAGLSLDYFLERELKNAAGNDDHGDKTKELKRVKLLEAVKNGSQLPLGIVVSEKARELDKRFLIVTSTYHHDISINPILNLINGKYNDRYDERFGREMRRKGWTTGILRILPEGSKQQTDYLNKLVQERE